jgi:hypothetical protein
MTQPPLDVQPSNSDNNQNRIGAECMALYPLVAADIRSAKTDQWSITNSVILLFIATAAVAKAAAAVTLHSQRRDITVSVTPPRAWHRPTHQVWPSYDTFTFGDQHKPTPCTLEVRFDPYTDKPGDRHSSEDIVIHWTALLSKPYMPSYAGSIAAHESSLSQPFSLQTSG